MVETVVVAPAVEPPTQLKTESATEVERSSSPVMVDSGGNSSPAAEDYVDALQVQQVHNNVVVFFNFVFYLLYDHCDHYTNMISPPIDNPS